MIKLDFQIIPASSCMNPQRQENLNRRQQKRKLQKHNANPIKVKI